MLTSKNNSVLSPIELYTKISVHKLLESISQVLFAMFADFNCFCDSLEANPLNCKNRGYLQILLDVFDECCISFKVVSIDDMITLLNIILILTRMSIMIVL